MQSQQSISKNHILPVDKFLRGLSNMEGHGAALSTNHFSVKSLQELSNNLTGIQKGIFDEMWNRYVSFGHTFSIRNLQQFIGKQSVEDALEGMCGSLMFETKEQNDSYFKLTVYGAFLTVHGPVLFSLIARLLDLVKELCENDSSLKELNKGQIKDRLGLSDAEIQILFKLLTLGLPAGLPIYLSGYAQDGSEWKIAITNEVIELLRADETEAYLTNRLSAGYRPDEPYSYVERLTYLSKRQDGFLLNRNNENSDKVNKGEIRIDGNRKRSDLSPWPVVRSFLLRLSSYEVPEIVDRTGLIVDWTLTDKENYSDKLRLAAYRPLIGTAFQSLSNDDDRLRVAYIVTQELAKRGSIDELNNALCEIGWELLDNRLAPSGSAIRELFFPEQSQHDAYVEIRAILQRATLQVAIVDPFIDQSILTLLSTCPKPGLSIQILTSRLPTDFALEGEKWLSQHMGSSLNVRMTKEFHDRFIVLDNSACWHIGCSIKDAGNKAFMLSELEDNDNRNALMAQVTRSWDTATIVL